MEINIWKDNKYIKALFYAAMVHKHFRWTCSSQGGQKGPTLKNYLQKSQFECWIALTVKLNI